MDFKKPILVTGATGKTGRKMIAALAARAAEIHAFFRRADAAQEIADLGAARTIVGDLFDRHALEHAIGDAGQVVHICPPMNPREAELARKVTDACRAAGVDRLILYSVLHPLLSGVRHHRLKLEAEHYLVESGQTYTIVQPSRYMQHLVPIWPSVIETGIHAMPFSTGVKFSVVDLNDLAEAAAVIATTPGHEAATYQLAGPEGLSQSDMAREISDILGRPVKAIAKSEADFRADAAKAGMPAERIEQICVMNKHYDRHGLTGNPNVLRWLLGREPTSFSAFVKRDLAPQAAP